MKKIIKLATMVIASLMVVAVGVYAATVATNLGVTSRISFTAANNVFTTVQGSIVGGNGGTRTYLGKSYTGEADNKVAANLATWAIGDIEFTGANSTIKFVLNFTNDTSEDNTTLDVTVTPGTTPSRVSVTTAGTVSELGKGESSEISVTLTLTGTTSLTAFDFSLSIVIEADDNVV